MSIDFNNYGQVEIENGVLAPHSGGFVRTVFVDKRSTPKDRELRLSS